LKSFIHFLITISLLTAGCEDNFTDPNDPKFGGEDKGLNIKLDQVHQTIHHFGSSDGWSVEIIGDNWPVTDRENISELLFSQEFDQEGNPKGIGLSMWRTNLGAGSANMVNSGFVSDAWFRETECALQPNGTYDWSQQTGTRWFMSKAKEMGVDYITAWITSPPYFMTKNGYTFITDGTAGYNLKEDKYNDFATYISEFVQYHSEQGIPIDFVSPINEPQYEWSSTIGSSKQEGSRCSNAEAFNLVTTINQKFVEANLMTKLILPESGNISVLHSFSNNYPKASDQVNSFFSSSSSNYIGALTSVEPLVAGHSYFSNSSVSDGIKNREDLRAVNLQHGIDFWQTEYSILGGDYLEGRSQSSLTDIDYSLWLARIMHWDLTIANSTGWSWWTSLSYPKYGDHKYRFGLLNWYPDTESRTNSSGEIETTKNLWTFGNFSRFIRPGYKRIEVDNTLFGSTEQESENLMVSAYLSQDNTEIVILLINYSEAIIEVPILNYGPDGDFTVVNDMFDAYLTDSRNDLTHMEVHAEQLTAQDKSLITLVGKLVQ